MLNTYRGFDYRLYNAPNQHRRFIYYGVATHHYGLASYGTSALGFYFPKFEFNRRADFVPLNNDIVAVLKASNQYYKHNLIHGHILNSELDGNISNFNLVPLTYSANSRHKVSEMKVKRMIQHLDRINYVLNNNLTYVVGYEVKVTAANGFPINIRLEANLYYLSPQDGKLVLVQSQDRLSNCLSGGAPYFRLPIQDSFNPLQ